MNYKGINMSNVKAVNRASVLYLLNKNSSMSRKDIAEALELTPAAVTKICADLLCDGFIKECGISQDKARVGRKKILLELNCDTLYVMAVSVEFHEATVSLCTLSGKAIKSEKINMLAESKAPVDYFDMVSEACNRLILQSEVKREDILAVGVGIVGSVDCEKGKTIGSYGIWQEQVEVKEMLEEKLNMPVCVENNVKAFALAQLIYDNSSSIDNILFVKWGPRVGSALVIGGEVFSGNDNSASEIGHYIVHPTGKPCRCGRRGCLETHASAQAIVERIRECYSEKNTPLLYKKTQGNINRVTFDFIRNEEQYDKCVSDIIDRRINRIARAVVNAATITNPDKIIVFGYMFTEKNLEKFVNDCKKYYSRYDEGFIKPSTLQKKSDYIGPAAVAAKKYFFEK